MIRIAASAWVRQFLVSHKAELRLCLRVTVSALLAFALSRYLQVPLVLWPVLTAVIVTQLNVGKSLKATIDYFIGTLGGAIYSGLISALVPHTSEAGLLLALALAVAPLALLAAINSSFSVAPFTAIIVLLVPLITHAAPFESALYRVFEVALGGFVALIVTLLVLPARAHHFAIDAAVHMLDLIADALPKLIAGFSQDADPSVLHDIQNGLGKAFTRLNLIEAEAKRERVAVFSAEPDLDSLLRTLLRIRHDLVMIGRSAGTPVPATLKLRLAPKLTELGQAASHFLRASGSALTTRVAAPPLNSFELALQKYQAAITGLRAEGATRNLTGETLEGLFALGFALEQLRQNFKDLQQRVTECARLPKQAELQQENGQDPR
jgi:hypothetical protein